MRQQTGIEHRLKEINKGIANIVKVVTETGSSALMAQLSTLEQEQASLKEKLLDIQYKLERDELNPKKLTTAFKKAKKMLQNGKLENRREIVDQYIDKIVIYKDKIDIRFNFSEDFSINETVRRSS